jgi:hypothetical protein
MRTASILTLILAATIAFAHGQASVTEDQVKAAYMFNFAKFVEWPGEVFSASAASMNFCAWGHNAVVDEVDSLVQGKAINGHPIKVRQLGRPEEVKQCHLVFVATANPRQQQQLLQAVKGLPVLLVGNDAGFARSGGIIGFVMENTKVSFEVNLSAAQEAHLKISSKLLAIARIVSPGVERAGQ